MASRGSESGVGAEEGLIIKKYVYSIEICLQRQIGYSFKCFYKQMKNGTLQIQISLKAVKPIISIANRCRVYK